MQNEMRDRIAEIIRSAHSTANPLGQFGYTEADALIANGVILPPCKVGDTVWIIGVYQGIYSATVRVFFFNHSGIEMIRTTKCDIPFSEFGKTVFLTREEAEEALKGE